MTRRADRLLALLELLRGRPVSTAARVAATLEVSIRTVYRDIDALVATGVPVRGEAGVGYTLEAGYHLPPLNLTAEEAEALALGARVLASWSDGAVAGQAAAALAKIRAVLPASGQAGVDRDVFWAPQWVERHAPKVDLLELKRAAQRRRVLVIEYAALNGARTTRTVRPLSINFFGPVWLLAAWCELAGDFRCFRLDRIDSMMPTGATFRDEDGKRLADFKRIKVEEARPTKFDTPVETDPVSTFVSGVAGSGPHRLWEGESDGGRRDAHGSSYVRLPRIGKDDAGEKA